MVTCSFSAFAKVSIQEKENRVNFIEKIGTVAPSIGVDAYKRELEYERQGLPLELRAKYEARLLAEKIQNQISFAYELAMKEHGDPEKAAQEVQEAINADLELAAPEFKKELLALSLKTLREVQNGGLANVGTLSNLEKSILPNVEARSKYLNEEVMDANFPQDNYHPSASTMKDAEKLEYKSTQELMESLVSDRESSRWVATANKNLSSGNTITTEANVSYQVKIEYLGIAVEAGPTITFKREYSTSANFMAEELYPIVLPDGNFDIHKRDARGKIVYKNGNAMRRYLAFFCSADLKFSTEYKGAGGFKVAGIGGGGSVSDTYSNLVNYNSRRIVVPDYVAGKTATIEYLSKLCNREFLKSKINDSMTVEQSLNMEMKNVISGLRFSHPKTKCAVDTHCIDWFNDEVITIWKYGTYPRCFEEPREKYRACALRGLEGMTCKVYDREGKLVSSGSWEVECDKNLKCVKTQDEGWMKYAKGKCVPVNPNTYRDPKKYPEYPTVNDYIEVQLIKK